MLAMSQINGLNGYFFFICVDSLGKSKWWQAR